MPTRKPRTSSGGLSRALRALLTVIITVIGVTLLSAGSASAQTAPMPPTAEFPYPHDGCTLVPDAPSGVSFNTACNHHDGCYYRHTATRGGCDAIFYRETVQACNAHRSVNYFSCLSFATLYYVGVRIFGQPFYDASTATTRVLTPMAA